MGHMSCCLRELLHVPSPHANWPTAFLLACLPTQASALLTVWSAFPHLAPNPQTAANIVVEQHTWRAGKPLAVYASTPVNNLWRLVVSAVPCSPPPPALQSRRMCCDWPCQGCFPAVLDPAPLCSAHTPAVRLGPSPLEHPALCLRPCQPAGLWDMTLLASVRGAAVHWSLPLLAGLQGVFSLAVVLTIVPTLVSQLPVRSTEAEL